VGQFSDIAGSHYGAGSGLIDSAGCLLRVTKTWAVDAETTLGGIEDLHKKSPGGIGQNTRLPGQCARRSRCCHQDVPATQSVGVVRHFAFLMDLLSTSIAQPHY
jgi:hypothetical protein